MVTLHSTLWSIWIQTVNKETRNTSLLAAGNLLLVCESVTNYLWSYKTVFVSQNNCYLPIRVSDESSILFAWKEEFQPGSILVNILESPRPVRQVFAHSYCWQKVSCLVWGQGRSCLAVARRFLGQLTCMYTGPGISWYGTELVQPKILTLIMLAWLEVLSYQAQYHLGFLQLTLSSSPLCHTMHIITNIK